ncbi:carboxyltransferase domain-containing protein, partial [Acinetobacter baumannii]
MSLDAFFKGMAITSAVRDRKIPGITDICPANASYQIRFDPDVIAPMAVLDLMKSIEAELGDAEIELKTRIIEIPVLYNDPWT